MPIITAAALAAIVGLSLESGTVRQGFAAQRDVLKAEIAIATQPASEIEKLPLMHAIEHDTEVARGEALTIVVSAQGCEKDARGACNISADVVTLRPDGSEYATVKALPLGGGRATAPLTFAAADVTGLYRVVATVRDLNARRFAKVERIFGVK
jgi:hypothetical protein